MYETAAWWRQRQSDKPKTWLIVIFKCIIAHLVRQLAVFLSKSNKEERLYTGWVIKGKEGFKLPQG